VFLETKKSSNLGVSLVGGNAVGIFTHSVAQDSPADVAGLRMGDQILEYNGSDLRHATAEEAAYELAKPADKVTVLVQFNIDSGLNCFFFKYFPKYASFIFRVQ
jgi:discs large protein 5